MAHERADRTIGGGDACYLYDARSSVQRIQPGDTHLSRTLRPLLCIAALCMSACASTTTFISTWKAPDVTAINPVGKSVVALVISRDSSQRRAAEIYLANDLINRGARAVPSYTLLGMEYPTVDAARARFKEAGVEGVVIMRMVGHDQTVIVDPGGFSGEAYGTFGSYYSSYGMSVSYSTGSVQTETEISIETLIYSLNRDKLIWAGTSRSSNPEGLQGLVTEVADAVANQVAKQGLVAR
jgi:hypothetical protein